MSNKGPKTVSSWGRLPGFEQHLEPATGPEVLAGLMQRNDGTLPVGLGRSYGDCGLASGGTAISMLGLADIEALDVEKDFPGVVEGIRGMAFIETMVKSAGSKSKWVKMPV